MRRLLVLALLCTTWGCGKNVPVPASTLVERDRDLYESAMKDISKSRHNLARINLQVLLATYPESEYVEQAKYAFAESHYLEGGSSAMIEAEVAFKDYITFFPDTVLTDDAQLKVAMTHVKQIEKPDRDDTQAKLAEYELNEMIRQYPDSDLLDEAKEKLRDVQEVLAESIFGPAKQYYMRRAYPAVINRCEEVLMKYPDFSGTDRVLFLLAESLWRSSEPERSAPYYQQIVMDYPLSDRLQDAKERLVELKFPIPETSPLALNRAAQREKEDRGFLSWLFGGGPTVSTDTNAATINGGALTVERPR